MKKIIRKGGYMKSLLKKITVLLLGVILFFPAAATAQTKWKGSIRVNGTMGTLHHSPTYAHRTYSFRLYDRRRNPIRGAEVIADKIRIPETSPGYYRLNPPGLYSPPSKYERVTIRPGNFSIRGAFPVGMIEAKGLIGQPVKILSPAYNGSVLPGSGIGTFFRIVWSRNTDSFTCWVVQLTKNDQQIGPQLFRRDNFQGSIVRIPRSILKIGRKYLFVLVQNLDDLPFVKGNVTSDSKIRRYNKYFWPFNTATKKR